MTAENMAEPAPGCVDDVRHGGGGLDGGAGAGAGPPVVAIGGQRNAGGIDINLVIAESYGYHGVAEWKVKLVYHLIR
jgi:hypothetical protein